MTEEQKIEIIRKAKDFFSEEIFNVHINQACERASKIKEYNINPFLVKYLANFLSGEISSQSIAKALVYPRVLGTSITTSFGSKTQKMISNLFDGLGSIVTGIDIEFIDAIDGRKKYCQLKGGPNTINKDDITTIRNHFSTARNLSRTNNLDVRQNDLIIGILYGTHDELNAHYKTLDQDYTLYVGKDFWYRLTGDENFYNDLTTAIGELANDFDGTQKLQETITSLAQEIEDTMA